MAIITTYVLLAALAIISTCAKSNTKIDSQRAEYMHLEKSLWQYLEQQNDTSKHQQLSKVFKTHRRFIAEHLQIDYNSDKFSPLRRHYEWSLLDNDLLNINSLFQYFHTFLKNYTNNNYDEYVLDVAESILDDRKLSLPKIFLSIENVLVKQALYVRAIADSSDQICAIKQSTQQFLYELYTDITRIELKGYAMMQFSWMIFNIFEKGNSIHDAQLMRDDFTNRSHASQKAVHDILRDADRVLWTCDSNSYIKGENYDELTRLLQGYIENEVDMNFDSSCREDCAYYTETKNHGCYQDLYCAQQQRCKGKILNCQYVDSDMWICPDSHKSTRRYKYVKYENGRVLGNMSSCTKGSTRVESWMRWPFFQCSYCFCLCDEQGVKSDRYFNLREVISDTASNRVVTGLRFIKVNRIFHLQIQEGQLLERGNINNTTLNWIPVDDYGILDHGVKDGVDYHTLNFASRALDLDNLEATGPYVVTGVKFRVVGAHLNLEMRVTEFNFKSGHLIEPKKTSYWVSNDNTDLSSARRTQITLESPDISTNTRVKSEPNSKHNQFIEFVNTNMDKDAAQTTVPFIDIQHVVPNPPVPLSGVGIYYKGTDNYGGFVAPKVITYDFSRNMS